MAVLVRSEGLAANAGVGLIPGQAQQQHAVLEEGGMGAVEDADADLVPAVDAEAQVEGRDLLVREAEEHDAGPCLDLVVDGDPGPGTAICGDGLSRSTASEIANPGLNRHQGPLTPRAALASATV